jgi:hypothetical protein
MLKITGIEDADHVPLYLLQPRQCKFPVAEDRKIPGHFLFCAAPTRPGQNYCNKHHLDSLPSQDARRKGK